ncbi:MAG: cation transporter [Actinomycetota bacterium]|nr:cation transporter [Actinomycetota bacterium]
MSKSTERAVVGPPAPTPARRRDALGSAVVLEVVSLGYNVLEAGVGIVAGIAAGSVALFGFGLDAVVESASAGVLIWRLGTERRGRRTAEEAERRAIRLVAIAFFALAAYVGGRAIVDLIAASRPEESTVGLVLAVVSLIVMPALARAKRRAARELDSRSLQADSAQTMLCTYMSAVLLAGLAANAALDWWWADPVAALGIAVLAAREGRELWVTEDFCCA